MEELKFSYFAGARILWCHHFGKQIGILKIKLNIYKPYDSAREKKIFVYKITYTEIFIAALFVMAQTRNNPYRHQPEDGLINCDTSM